MPVKMIAVGRYYDNTTGKEHKHGAEFHVADDKAADRLERIRKAKRAHPHVVTPVAPAPVVEPVAVDPPAPARSYTRRVLTPEPAVVGLDGGGLDDNLGTAAVVPVETSSSEPVVPIPTSRLGRYRRNDMRSED